MSRVAGVFLAALALPWALAAQHGLAPDPTRGEVRLPAASGWQAFLLYDAGVGIWTVRSFQLRPELGCPEVVGLDDLGRCTVLVSYSGKWTPFQAVADGQWLAPVAHADLNPRVPGAELYTGGKAGNLYCIRVLPRRFAAEEIAHFPGQEIHTLVGGDLLPARKGDELLAFLGSGAVHFVRSSAGHGFKAPRIATMPGRVRDAVLLPAAGGEAPWIATVNRCGEVALLRLRSESKLEKKVLLREPMGFGRIARRPARAGEPPVLYVTRDDGLILRLQEEPSGAWRRELVYAGPQGARGVVAGHFVADPAVETIAVFGYCKKVQLLSRRQDGAWRVETVFTDRDKGHWLAAAELDGRNTTDEIIGSGYGGRIFMLARPPGYGLEKVPTDPEAGRVESPWRPDRGRPIRIAVKASEIASRELSPLVYQGGFETKTLIYETLVRRDAAGCIIPALASSWRLEDGGRSVLFHLRAGATFHDGQPVTAKAVTEHFMRWVGLPEHAWLRASQHITRVRAVAKHELRVTMDRPYPLLADLCAINPCAVRGPGALDREGRFVRPVGSGPFRLLGVGEGGRLLRLARHRGSEPTAGGGRIDLVRFDKRAGDDPLAALLRGEVDVLPGGWLYHLPRPRIAELRRDPTYRVIEGPGSSLTYLSFNLHSGPTAERSVRRTIAAAINRRELISEVECGHADPCRAWAAPTVEVWPRPPAARPPSSPVHLKAPLRILVGSGRNRRKRLARALEAQLLRAGMPARILTRGGAELEGALRGGTYDLRLEVTWGVPYDPYISLVSRFLPPPPRPSAAAGRFFGVDRRLLKLVEKATHRPEQAARTAVYREIQALITTDALLVPLYVPRRFAVLPRGLAGMALDHDLYRVDLRFLTDKR